MEKNFDLAFQVIYEFNLPGSQTYEFIFIAVFLSCANQYFFFFSVYKPCLISFIAAVDIYAGVAASLAERKRGGQLTEFFRNIKGTIDDDDWDQVL